MEELDKGLEVSIKGRLREEALAKVREQLAEWQVAIPPADPLVLDFGLGDFYDIGLVEYWIANEMEAGYCGKYLFVFNGQTCPAHHHREKMETFFLVKGRMKVVLEGEQKELASEICKELKNATTVGIVNFDKEGNGFIMAIKFNQHRTASRWASILRPPLPMGNSAMRDAHRRSNARLNSTGSMLFAPANPHTTCRLKRPCAVTRI